MPTTTALSQKERAKQIIAEIIRVAGGKLASKAELVRTYWRAHLIFAESQPGYLSFWPLSKTPAGPMIKNLDRLLGELVADETLQIDETTADGVTALRLKLAVDAAAGELPQEALAAVETAVRHPGEPLDLSDYRTLRSWNEAADGEELNIYLDAIPQAEYAERKERLGGLAAALNSAWQ